MGDRLADFWAVLRVTGGRLAPRPPQSQVLGIYHLVETILPRNAYSLSVSLDESRVCITPADMVRVLGLYDEIGPPPIGLRGPWRMEHSLTSGVYRHSARGQPFAGLSSASPSSAALTVSVYQPAPDQPESPR
jgi:hypothetical protein